MQISQQDQPCPPERQSLLDGTDAPSTICTRRRLAYSNGRSTSAVRQGASGGSCTSEKNQKRGEAPNSAVIFLTLILLVSAEKRGALLSRISKKQNFFCWWGFKLSGTKRSTDESMTSRKRKRKEGSPLLEMPDFSQTQKIYSQTSQLESIQVFLSFMAT